MTDRSVNRMIKKSLWFLSGLPDADVPDAYVLRLPTGQPVALRMRLPSRFTALTISNMHTVSARCAFLVVAVVFLTGCSMAFATTPPDVRFDFGSGDVAGPVTLTPLSSLETD